MTKSGKKHFFEEGLDRLEEIASLLDDESISLEEALGLYEEGTRLRAKLGAYLAEAERRVTVLDAAQSGESIEETIEKSKPREDTPPPVQPEAKAASKKAKSAKQIPDSGDEGSLFG